jgi:hypothetical protein
MRRHPPDVRCRALTGPDSCSALLLVCPDGGGARLAAPRAYRDGMGNDQAFPVIRQTVLDTTDPRRQLQDPCGRFGSVHRPSRRVPSDTIAVLMRWAT